MFLPRTHAAAALLLTTHAALVGWAATRHSPSSDEVAHMAAGLSHWQFARFDLYRVNPPLVRMVATAPVVLLRPRTNWDGYSTSSGGRPEYECGQQFIDANGRRSFWLFSVARCACIPFSLLGGYLCYRWAGELYGPGGGLLALALWCFCPNVLAHAEMITPDVGASALGVAACYLFWRWLRVPSWALAFGAGVVLGLAELSKTTFVVFYALWPLASVVWKATGGGAARRAPQRDAECPQSGGVQGGKPALPNADPSGTEFIPLASSQTAQKGNGVNPVLREATQLALMLMLALDVVNAGYGFEGSFQPLGKFHFVSEALRGPRDAVPPRSTGRNRFAGTPLAGFRVPLPANYVLGIDQQKSEFERGYPSYLRGVWRHGGWWYYYLYALAVKVPLGTWALFVMAATLGFALRVTGVVWGGRCGGATPISANSAPAGATWRDEFVLLLPAAIILTFVSSQTGFNHHLRYVLPIFPFVFIWIGRLGRWVVGTGAMSASDLIQSGAEGPVPNRPPRNSGWQCRSYGTARWPFPTESRVIRALGATALAWSIGGSLWYYPHSLSYFNELAGGPLGGRWHLLNSNLDWGQDLLYLKRWLDDHPQARPLAMAYCGFVDPRVAGIDFSLPPLGPVEEDDASAPRRATLGPRPGWYAVSVMMLHGGTYSIHDGKGTRLDTNQPYFAYFQHFRPAARAGYSIYIYHLQPEEVGRVRRELALPPL